MKYLIGGGLLALLLYYLNKGNATPATVTSIGTAPNSPVFPPEMGAPLGATGARVCCGTATQVASPGVPPSPSIPVNATPVTSGTGDGFAPVLSTRLPVLTRPPIIFWNGPTGAVPVTQSPAVPAAPQPAPSPVQKVNVPVALPVFRSTAGAPTIRQRFVA
jgi:hypothetical protein